MKRSVVPLLIFGMVLLPAWATGCTSAGTVPTGAPVASSSAVSRDQVQSEQQWLETLSAAKKEGEVVIYGEIGAPVKEILVNGFKEKYGIEVQIVAGKSAELAAKLERETSANLHLVDAFIMGPTTLLLSLKPKGLLGSMSPLLIRPEVADGRVWAGGQVPFLDKDKTGVELGARYATFVARNTDMIKENDIKSYQDLLDPRWKDKISLFDPTVAGTSNAWITQIIKLQGSEEGKKYLRRFATQQPSIIKDARLHVEWIGRGKYPVGVGPNFGTVTELQQAGVPVAWVRVAEGGMMHPGSAILAVSPKPAHPNALAVLVNWVLGPEFQEAFGKVYGAPSIRLDVKKEGFDPMTMARPGDKVYWMDEDWVMAQGPAFDVAKDIFGPLMK